MVAQLGVFHRISSLNTYIVHTIFLDCINQVLSGQKYAPPYICVATFTQGCKLGNSSKVNDSSSTADIDTGIKLTFCEEQYYYSYFLSSFCQSFSIVQVEKGRAGVWMPVVDRILTPLIKNSLN
jgi:hypothetical protein